jgi:RsiW-degrading membrane proteinase PrsW (M82 family)
MFLVLLLIALAPCLFLLWYFIRRDRYEPEPKKYIFKIFLLGALMVIPAIIIELLLELAINKMTYGVFNAFIMSFVVIAPTEELLKFFAVKKWIYRSVEFDEVMDGIMYCVASSLGFATIENIMYVLGQGAGTGILRAFMAVPGHAFFGVLMGYYLGRAKLDRANERKLILLGVLFAILAHGLYDFFLLTKTVLAILSLALIVVLAFIVRKGLKKAELQSQARTAILQADPGKNGKQTTPPSPDGDQP